jgi:hypothetical protein
MGGVGDLFQDRVEIGKDLLIREAKNHVVLASEVRVSALIVRALLLPLVHLSVKLDDDPPIATAEVCDEWTNQVLTDEFEPM